MFDKSSSWQSLKGETPNTFRVHLGYVPDIDTESEDRESRIRTRIAVGIAIALHGIFFLLNLPEMEAKPMRAARKQEVYVVQQIRFNPPPPQRQEQIPKRAEKRKKVPIPDPTPDEPEPIVIEEVEVPETDLTGLEDAVFGVPNVPAGFGRYPGSGPMKVGGSVLPPRKTFSPAPPYTEEARQGRIQGVVILEAIIDAEGNVRDVKVLKGLPMGLGESAVETAMRWKFEPATMQGEPVAVYFSLTIRFSLQ
jgi:protein TonB